MSALDTMIVEMADCQGRKAVDSLFLDMQNAGLDFPALAAVAQVPTEDIERAVKNWRSCSMETFTRCRAALRAIYHARNLPTDGRALV